MDKVLTLSDFILVTVPVEDGNSVIPFEAEITPQYV